FCFFFQAEDGIRDFHVTGVQTCALPISALPGAAFSFQAGAVAPALGGRRCPEPREQSFDVHSDREPRPCGFRWTAKAMEERSQRSEERRVGKEGRSQVWQTTGREDS